MERCQWRCFGVFIVNFEHISHLFLMFLLLTLNKKILAGKQIAFCTKVCNLKCRFVSLNCFMKITSHLRYYKIHDLSILFYSQWKSKCSNCSKKIQTPNCFEKIFFMNPFTRRKKVNKYSLSFKAFLLYRWALLCQNKPVLFKILSTFRMQSQPLILLHCWGINIEN